MLRALGCLVLVVACTPPALPSVDPCAAEIIRLEGLRDQEVTGACDGQSFDECTPVIERINAKYAPAILDQIRCGNDH